MANYKIKDRYFINYDRQRYEVSEEIYRSWIYYYNMEKLAIRAYYSHAVYTDKQVLITKPSRLVSIFEDAVANTISSKEKSFLSDVIANEECDILHKACSMLPQDLYDVITLLYFQNLTECEAADILGVCQATISNRKRRALEALRYYFDKNHISLNDFSELLS